MSRALQMALLLLASASAGCELIVDPSVVPSKSTGQTTAESGALGSSGGAGSGASTASVGSGGTTEASGSGGASSGDVSSDSTASSSGSVATAGSTASSGNLDGSSASSGNGPTTGSVGTSGIATGGTGVSSSSSSSSSGGSSSSSSSSSSGTTSSSSSSGSSSSSSGSSGSSGGCPGPFGGDQTRTIGGAVGVESTLAGSIGGRVCPPVVVDGPPPPSPYSDWAAWPVPDSRPACAGGNCQGLGTDPDYIYPASQLCSIGTLHHASDAGAFDADFATDAVTSIGWQEDGQLDGLTYPVAAAECDPSVWSDVLDNAPAIGLPAPIELVELLDFGGNGNLSPDDVDEAGETYWTQASGPTAFAVNFSTGTFVPFEVGSGGTGQNVHLTARCALRGAAGPDTVGQSEQPTAFGAVGSKDVALTDPASGNLLNGLWFHRPDTQAATWSDALDTCNNLGNACGLYRLPSYKELATLVNFTSRTTQSTLVDSMHGTNFVYWTSTPARNFNATSPQAMAIQFGNVAADGGHPNSLGMVLATVPQATTPPRVICVRGP